MFDGIIEAINDMCRNLLYEPLDITLSWLEGIVDVIMTEIAKFNFINLSFINECYTTCIQIALILLPLKLVYEWLWLMIGNDIEKWSSKVFATFQIIVIILFTPPVLDLVSTGVNVLNDGIMSGEIISGSSKDTAITQGKNFAATVLTATTDLSQTDAESFMKEYDKTDFDINERDEDDNYIYDFNFLMPAIVCLVMWVLVFFCGLQMAVRQVSVGFYKIIMPLCALSLTNKDQATAFSVCKNSLVGSFLMNSVQIFLFVFSFRLISELGEISAIAKLLFTVALVLAIIFIPNKVAAMIGGYSSGIMESLNSIQSALMATNAATSMVRSGIGTAVGAGAMAKGGFNKLRKAPASAAKLLGAGASKADHAGNVLKQAATTAKDYSKHVSDTVSDQGMPSGTKTLGKEAASAAKNKTVDTAKIAAANGKAGVKNVTQPIMSAKHQADDRRSDKQKQKQAKRNEILGIKEPPNTKPVGSLGTDKFTPADNPSRQQNVTGSTNLGDVGHKRFNTSGALNRAKSDSNIFRKK